LGGPHDRRAFLDRQDKSTAPHANLKPIGEFTLKGIRRAMAARHVLAAVNQARG
jgi:hypothetical protein